MLLREANEILRRALLANYFEPQLLEKGYQKAEGKHPTIGGHGLSKDGVVHLYFDLNTGSEYPDGDEWFIVEFLVPFDLNLPDQLKGPDYFVTLASGDGKTFWKHRELIRFRYGKVKRLDDALEFIDRKAGELHASLADFSVLEKIRKEK